MNQRHFVLFRNVSVQNLGQSVDIRNIAGLRLLPLRRPPLELTLGKGLAAGQVVQPGLFQVNSVDAGEGFGHRQADRATLVLGQLLSHRNAVDHNAVDVAHEDQRSVRDLRIFRDAEDLRNRHFGSLERGQDAVLANDVVRGSQQRAEWRSAQYPPSSARIRHGVGQVRLPVTDPLESQWCRGADPQFGDPRGNSFFVQTDCSHRTDASG